MGLLIIISLIFSHFFQVIAPVGANYLSLINENRADDIEGNIVSESQRLVKWNIWDRQNRRSVK